MQSYTNNIQDSFGNVVPGATVLIKTAAGATATIYSDNGVTVTGNPITPNPSTGAFSFYAADGNYTVTTQGVGTPTVTALQLFDSVANAAALAASGGSALVGFIQAGTGAVATTGQAELRRNFLTPEQFGAVGNGVADDSAAWAACLTEAISQNRDIHPQSRLYLIASTIAPAVIGWAGDPSLRDHSVRIVGRGAWSTILNYTGTGYCLNFQTNIPANKYIDAVHVEGLQIKTATGGGIACPAGGGIKFLDFFMNGCAAGKWGLLLDGSYDGGVGIYNIDIDGCRFWHNNTDYQGGAIYCENFLGLSLNRTFISQQYKNGDICFFGNGRVLQVGGGTMIEGVNAATTAQVGIAVGGAGASDSIFSTNISDVYFEGRLDTCIKVGTTRQFQVKVDGLFANFYAGKASPIIFDAGTTANHVAMSVNNATYFNADTGVGAGYVFNDPNKITRVAGYFNASAGNQASRVMSQSLNVINPTNQVFGDTTTGVVGINGTGSIPQLNFYKWSGVGLDYNAFRITQDGSGNVKFGIASAAAAIGSETIVDVIGFDRTQQLQKQLKAGFTGAVTATLGANAPAGITTTPYTWVQSLASDGSTVYSPVWK